MGAMVKQLWKQRLRSSFLTLGLLCVSCIKAEPIEVNFDMIVANSWYQKGLISLMRVWHIIMCLHDAHDKVLFNDVIIEKLLFTQFCIERMYEGNIIIDEADILYGVMVIQKIYDLLRVINIDSFMGDYIDCIMNILFAIEECFKKLYVPSNIQAIGSA